MRISEGWLENDAGARVGRVRAGEMATLVLRIEVRETTPQPIIGFGLRGEDGSIVYSDNSIGLGVTTDVYAAGAVLEVRVRFLAALRDGRYTVMAAVSDAGMTMFLDLVDRLTSFVVHGCRSRVLATPTPGAHNYIDLQGDLRCTLVAEAAHSATAASVADQKG